MITPIDKIDKEYKDYKSFSLKMAYSRKMDVSYLVMSGLGIMMVMITINLMIRKNVISSMKHQWLIAQKIDSENLVDFVNMESKYTKH